jgi:type IX secretion system substrate protein
MRYKVILFLILIICYTTGYSQTTLYSEDFESKTEAGIPTTSEQGWDLIINASDGLNIWSFSGDDPLNGSMSLAIDENTTDSENTFDNSAVSDKIAYYETLINGSGYYNLKLSYKWRCEGDVFNGTFNDYGKVVYSTDGTNWTDLTSEHALQSNVESKTNLNISSLDNTQFYIGFQFISDGDWFGDNPAFAIDDILITGYSNASCSDITYPTDGTSEISLTPILLWNKDDAATGYKVYLGTDTPPTNILNGVTTSSTAFYIDSDLASNTLHYLKIVPYNGNGDATGCSIISFTTIDPTSYTEWDGSSSGDWATAANWSNGVPDNSTNVIIPVVEPGANKPTISANADVDNITFETGGVLTIADGVTLSVYGEWNNYFGTLKGNTGIIEFKGTGTSLAAYSTPSYEIDGLQTSGATTTSTLTGSGDYRGGIAVTPDYVYVTGDGGTVRMNADDLSSPTIVTERDAFFSDLLTGKLYSLWNSGSSIDPDCLCDDNATGTGDACVETFTLNALCELNTDLSASTNIIPLVDIDGNAYSITCKGGQNSSWIFRTGIFPGYGFLLLFADNDNGDERMYAIDIQSGEVDSLGFKNITPELEVSEGFANWGFGEYDGSDYYLIYKMLDTEKLRRVNLTTMETNDYIDFSGTDGLAYMSSITFSPWKSSWYFYLEGPSEFDNGVAAGTEVVGFATGSNKITVNSGLPEILTNVTINKTNSTDILTLSSPLTLRNLTLTNGEIDVSTDNHELTIKGDLSVSANGTLTTRSGNIVFGGLSAQSFTGTSVSFYDISLDKSSGIFTLNNDLTISNSLTLTNGIISTGSNKIDLSSNSTSAISGGSSSSFVNGNIERAITSNTSTYEFPVGNGTTSTNFYQIDFVNNNLTGVSDLTASVSAVTESGNNVDSEIIANEGAGNNYSDVLGDAIWEIIPTGTASGGDYGVHLHFGNLSGSLTDNLFGVLKRASGSTSYADWDSFHASTTVPADDAVGRTVAGGYAKRSGFNSFSEFGIATSQFSLPVEWVDFHGYSKEQNNVLKWTTTSEINNDRFIIEKSHDGFEFSILGQIQGNGNFNGLSHYSFTDESVSQEINYYRIKQIDFDGNFEYSKTINIHNLELKNSTHISYLSNTNEIQINFGDQSKTNWNIIIIDYCGKIVYNNKLYNSSHEQFVNFELPSLNHGLYLINLKSTSQSYTTRMIVE